MTAAPYCGPVTYKPARGWVRLTYGQRQHAREQYQSALREARACLREARLWRQMAPERAAARYVDQRQCARHLLRVAALARRRATLYAWHWQTGLAAAGSAWDERAWVPSTSAADAHAVTGWPILLADGQTVWACCVTGSGARCAHQTGLPVIGMAGCRPYPQPAPAAP